MIESERIADVNSIEDLQNINREIVELGEKIRKAGSGNMRRTFFKS